MFFFIDYIGLLTLNFFNSIGNYCIFIFQFFSVLFTTRLKIRKVIFQMEQIGVNSFFIVALTGFFAGAVICLQIYYGFVKFGTENMIGSIVAITMTRELGPVLTGLMVAARSGAGIAAELGTMQITEQLDALKTLNIDIYQYLIVPRILAGVLIIPFLTVFAMFIGIFGGYLIYVYYFDLNQNDYISVIKEFLEGFDIIGGLIKSSVFAFILTSISCFKGITTRGGAKDVGRATTESVVLASIVILVSNYFLANVLFNK